MSDVSFSASGPPETILPDPDPRLMAALDEATTATEVAAVVASHPADPFGWAALGDAGADPITTYAFYRVGYHRGLDLLRKNGWKGAGYVRSVHPSNRGFLRCLTGLGDAAATIGESEEAERCRQFLAQLDPKTD